MRQPLLLLAFASLLASTEFPAQTVPQPAPKAAKHPYYIDPQLLDLTLILPPPPPQASDTTRSELEVIHHIEQTRTPAQVAAAQYDDHHEDIFLFASVIGPVFTAEALPLTAALSAHIRNDNGVIDPPLKALYARPRPYNFDATLHPVCDTNHEGSYPSGHSLNGYLLAFALAQILPEKSQQILARADDYAHNRVICEAHYPSDLEASRRVAYVMIAYMLATPRFQRDLAAARAETRQHLGLPTSPSR